LLQCPILPKKRNLLIRLLKKSMRILGFLAYTLVVVLLLLELAYRFYWVDFYRMELLGLNPSSVLNPKKEQPTILALGDSFTASPHSYLEVLKKSNPDLRIINSGVPGTSIRQAALMAPKRLQRFQPEALIYQIYLGNDLLEFRHPTSSPRLSWVRRSYWWLSDRIQVLGYLNNRLRFLRKDIYNDLPADSSPQTIPQFSPSHYSARSKMHFLAEAQGIEHTVNLSGDRQEDVQEYFKALKKMLANVPEDRTIVLLVIPHCMQVNALYRERMIQLGAIVEQREAIPDINYPFIQALEQSIDRPNTHLLNALVPLQAAAATKTIYYENDPHLNVEGQRFLGQFVTHFFEQARIFE